MSLLFSYVFWVNFVIFIIVPILILLTILLVPKTENTKLEELSEKVDKIFPSTKIVQLNRTQYDDSLFESFEDKLLSDDCYMVLIHLGEELPLHIFDCMDQLVIMGVTKIHFIVDSTRAYQRLTYCNAQVIPYLYKSDEKLREKMNAVHGDENVFHLSLERFFALKWFMSKYNVDKCIHIEHDNLIYIPLSLVENQLSQIVGEKIAVPRDNEDRCIASIFYVGSLVCLEKYCDFIATEENFQYIDMASLSNFEKKYPEYCTHLPVIPCEYVTKQRSVFSNSQIPFIFDAAALGQWVGGVDIIHATFGVDSRGFINPDALNYYTADQMPVIWILTKSGKKVPLTRYQIDNSRVVYTRLCNLHVHSKRLHLYLSTSYMDPNDIIQGNKFRDFADIRFQTLEEIMNFSKQQNNFVKKPEIIYVKTDFITEFFENAVPSITTGNFILITHNSDYCITDDHIPYLKNDRLLKWFAQNCQIEHPKLVPIPIGIANSEFEHGNTDILLESMKTKTVKDESLLYVNLSPTHEVRKQLIEYYTTHENPQVYIEKDRLSYSNFLTQMKLFEFVSAPRGNGPDTHRLWEIYYLNSIPVTYDKLFQTTACIPYHYLPFVDVDTFQWQPYSEDLIYRTQIRGLGRIYGRMSYWKYMLRMVQKAQKNIDMVIISNDAVIKLSDCIESMIRYVYNLNKIFIVRFGDLSEEDIILNQTSTVLKILKASDLVADHKNNPEVIKLYLYNISGVQNTILCVDARLCFTCDIHFQTYKNQYLFTNTKGDDSKYVYNFPEIVISRKLNVDESYHCVYDKDILKELQEKTLNQSFSYVPTDVLYFHYLQTFYKDRVKMRNLFFLATLDSSEYLSAIQSKYYRFAVNLS